MADETNARRWSMRAIYVGLCLLVMFFHLLPLSTVPRGWAGPDLLVALSFAWVVRRPDYVPTLAVAAMLLLADMLFQRPPGLWSALVLIAMEGLRSSGRRSREAGFGLEWLNMAVMLAVITLVYQLILMTLIAGPPPLMLSIMALVATIAVYPVVVLLSRVLLGVRKAAPGAIDALGHRI